MNLPVNSDTFSFDRIFDIKPINTHTFLTEGYCYFVDGFYTRIWNYSINDSEYWASNNFTVGELYNVTSTSESLTIYNESIPKYGYPCTKIEFSENNSNYDSIHRTSAITVDGVVRYVPVRLLKDLPSTLDANNKFRPAGTCGMWDKINNKFYGNVASTGSFTVTNDD